MGTWTNSDGLYIKYGTSEAGLRTAGENNKLGLLEVEATITLTGLAVATESIVSDTVFLPKGARIQEVETVAKTLATTGTTSTLDVGLIRTDRTTELDYNGLIADAAITNWDAAGEKVVFTPGVTGVGALVGTTLAYAGLLTAGVNTAVFTAGVLIVRVRYFMP